MVWVRPHSELSVQQVNTHLSLSLRTPTAPLPHISGYSFWALIVGTRGLPRTSHLIPGGMNHYTQLRGTAHWHASFLSWDVDAGKLSIIPCSI